MISLVSLLVAAALVSQQCGFEANAQIDDSKRLLDNNLQPNLVAPVKPRRVHKKFINIRMEPAEEVKRLAGQRVELKCAASASPPPVIYWLKNGETVEDPSEEMNEILAPTTTGFGKLISKIIISSSTPGEDEFTCVAEAGEKRSVATCTVFTIPTDTDEVELLSLQELYLPTKPIITYSYNALLQEQGNAVVLPCRAYNQAESQLEWEDNHQRPIHTNSRMKVLPSGDLFIYSLRWSDLGNFTCIVKNLNGKNENKTFVYPIKPGKK